MRRSPRLHEMNPGRYHGSLSQRSQQPWFTPELVYACGRTFPCSSLTCVCKRYYVSHSSLARNAEMTPQGLQSRSNATLFYVLRHFQLFYNRYVSMWASFSNQHEVYYSFFFLSRRSMFVLYTRDEALAITFFQRRSLLGTCPERSSWSSD